MGGGANAHPTHPSPTPMLESLITSPIAQEKYHDNISYPIPIRGYNLCPPPPTHSNTCPPSLGNFLHPCLSRYENKERKLFVFFPLRRLLSSLPRQTNAFQKPVHICLHYATWWLVGCEVSIFGSPNVQTLGLSKSMFFKLTILGVTCYEEKFYALRGYVDALRLSPSCHCKDGHTYLLKYYFPILWCLDLDSCITQNKISLTKPTKAMAMKIDPICNS